eukprot:4838353-Alexandrium_andersonii.AAC.1
MSRLSTAGPGLFIWGPAGRLDVYPEVLRLADFSLCACPLDDRSMRGRPRPQCHDRGGFPHWQRLRL